MGPIGAELRRYTGDSEGSGFIPDGSKAEDSMPIAAPLRQRQP